jgi:hypothetical protein
LGTKGVVESRHRHHLLERASRRLRYPGARQPNRAFPVLRTTAILQMRHIGEGGTATFLHRR